MALSTNIEVKTLIEGYVVPYEVNGADVFYKGALVNTNAAGKLVVASDTAGQNFAGVVKEYKDAAVGDKVEVVRNGVMAIPHTGAALTDIGDDAYATADDTIAATATNVARCGIVVDVDVTNALLWIDFSKSNATIDTTG